jgi:hypothetical protein
MFGEKNAGRNHNIKIVTEILKKLNIWENFKIIKILFRKKLRAD